MKFTIFLAIISIMNNAVALSEKAVDNDNSVLRLTRHTLDYSSSELEIEKTTENITQLCFNSSGPPGKVWTDKEVSYIICSNGEPLLKVGYCATYSEKTKLISITEFSNFQYKGYNVTTDRYIRLPRNLSQLNHYMCAPLNRKGIVCSECTDGFGPSLNSFDYKCANCTNVWYGLPLFLFLEFVPITVFYLFILTFRISVTSPPMPCFIMYAQLVGVFFQVIIFHTSLKLKKAVSNRDGDLSLSFNIFQTFYAIFNFHFFRSILPPICISSHLKYIYISLFGYNSVLYPLVLIFLTCLFVELHGRNVRPLVWLWRPFHRCFVRLRRGWDTRSDITDAFTTFFILSYSKCVYQSLFYLSYQTIINFDEFGTFVSLSHRQAADLTVDYSNKTQYLFSILAVILFILFCILPPILLTLYSSKVFWLCLNKCHLNNITMNTFVEKFHSSYRDGLGGGRDMRYFSGLYFFLRFLLYSVGCLCNKLTGNYNMMSDNMWFSIGSVFLTVGLIVALCRPYKKNYMNVMDSLLLYNLAIQCYVISSSFNMKPMLIILQLAPVVVFALIFSIRLMKSCIKALRFRQCLKCFKSFRKGLSSSANDNEDITSERKPLIQPS